ncbi:hypothetical protein [Domibacillus aminovorans]|nr:hypothetical protein [Domibacillus aminovorans]
MKTGLNVPEAAAFSNIYSGMLYRYVKEGNIPYYRLGLRVFSIKRHNKYG